MCAKPKNKGGYNYRKLVCAPHLRRRPKSLSIAESQVVTPQKADHHIQIMKDTLAGVKRGAEQLEDVMDQEPIRAVKVAQ